MAIPLVLSGIAFSAVVQQAEAQTSNSTVRLRVARFWRGDGRTLLEGIVGVPVATSSRSVQLTVRDTSGKTLHSETYSDTAGVQAAALTALNAQTTNTFEMVLRPGLYHVTVSSTEGSRTDSAQSAVRGFAEAPVISDVVLSPSMRVLAEAEKPGSGEMQRGRYAIERSARVTVLPAEPKLWYYIELYRQGADSVAQLSFRVVPEGKDSALVRVTRNVQVGARGTVDAAALVVQGLPPGDYRLHITARSGSREDVREAAFTMGSFETGPVAPIATPGASLSENAVYERYFISGVRSDAEINDLVEALTVGAPGERVGGENTQLTTDAKRRFLARYWSRLPDPAPATAAHEMLDEYAQRVSFIERNFRESQSARRGIKTDRGRIYLKYGAPDASQHLVIASSNKSVDVWKYTGRRPLKYVFLDETGFRNFNLVYTTDPVERTLSDWQERVFDVDTIRDILNF